MQNLDELFENLNEFVKNFEILIQKALSQQMVDFDEK